jgi:polar amino acid transport system permease protein
MAAAPTSATPLDFLLRALRVVTLAVIDVVRAIPLLLMVLLCYYGFPILFPSFDRTNVFVPCLVAFSLNLGAFTGELVRAGVMALPPGSALAARSLGLSPRQTWIQIVLPQIVRDILPAQVVLFITIVKMSTLASAVSLYEILHSGNAVIQQTYRPLEIYVAIGLFFVIVIVPFAMLARRLETVSVFRRRAL